MDRLLRWLLMSTVAGPVAAGLGWLLIESVSWMGRVIPGVTGPYLAPILGAVAASLLIGRYPVVAGTGGDVYIASLRNGPKPPAPNPLASILKVVGTALTVGSGGSGGLAGPSLQIGAGIQGVINPLFRLAGRLDERDTRTARIVGAAAVLAAVIGTPLAAGILAVEILDRAAIDYREIPPALMGGASGGIFFRLLTGRSGPFLASPPDPSGMTLLSAVLVGLLAGVAGLGLVRLLAAIRRLGRGFAPRPMAIILGAALTAALAAALGTEILGWGVVESLHAYSNSAPVGARGWTLLLGKVVGTAATVGGGGSGGVIGPALVIGTFAGNGIASLLGTSVTAASVTGMAASLAAISNVPIAAAVMMIELYGGSATVYACIGSAIGFQVARSGVAYFSLPDRE